MSIHIRRIWVFKLMTGRFQMQETRIIVTRASSCNVDKVVVKSYSVDVMYPKQKRNRQLETIPLR